MLISEFIQQLQDLCENEGDMEIVMVTFKVNDKVRCSRFDICWIISFVPCKCNGNYDGKIHVRVNPSKKDGTRSHREYLLYSWEFDSIKKID